MISIVTDSVTHCDIIIMATYDPMLLTQVHARLTSKSIVKQKRVQHPLNSEFKAGADPGVVLKG